MSARPSYIKCDKNTITVLRDVFGSVYIKVGDIRGRSRGIRFMDMLSLCFVYLFHNRATRSDDHATPFRTMFDCRVTIPTIPHHLHNTTSSSNSDVRECVRISPPFVCE